VAEVEEEAAGIGCGVRYFFYGGQAGLAGTIG